MLPLQYCCLVTFCFVPSSSHHQVPLISLLYSCNANISMFAFPLNLPLCWLCLSSFLILPVTTVIFTPISSPPPIWMHVSLLLLPPLYASTHFHFILSFPDLLHLPLMPLPPLGIPLALLLLTPDLFSRQVFLPGWGGHVYGGGLALGGRPALSPAAERPLLREHCQTLHLWIVPGPGIFAHQAHNTQVRCFPFYEPFLCSLLYCSLFN